VKVLFAVRSTQILIAAALQGQGRLMLTNSI